jgi:ABC-type oligopeptide transport system ATPase subunit
VSVEISGPQGYEYQYLLTAYIAVNAYIRWGASSQLVVEPLDGEDAELSCKIGTIYIQAKLSAGTLDTNKMLEWLEHSPRNTGSLWQRVAKDKSRQALIATSARCNDAVSNFCGPIGLTEYKHDRSPLSPQSVSDALARIVQHDGGNKATIMQTAKRIVVWEQVTPELLWERTQNEIIRVEIARSQAGKVIGELLDAIRTARNTRSDCFPKVVRILTKWRNTDLIIEPQTVVEREDINELENVLRQEGLLLLHGHSHCGKTTTARMLLARMRATGFSVHIGQDIREASRILYATGNDDIAYLLDDPISSKESDRTLVWESLLRFVPNLPPHRYLIITSRTDDLYSLLGPNESDWSLVNNSWINLTVTKREFLLSVWRQVSFELSSNVIEMIEQHIMQDPVDNLLQPGQLWFLSRQSNDELTNLNQLMLLSKARFNSRSLANLIANQGATVRDVLRALSLATTHVEVSSERDIIYILSNELTYPSEDTRKPSFITYSLGKHNHRPPQYQSTDSLTDAHAEALDSLERRGLIHRDKHLIRFTHPDYYEAAVVTREVRTHRDGIAIENYFLRAIFCADASTARTAARSLGIERQRLQARNSACDSLFKIALRGLRSLYPAVVDTCLEMLILGVDELSTDEQRIVWESLDNYYADYQVIDWDNGHPWIVPTEKRRLIRREDLAPPSKEDNSSFATWFALQQKTLAYDLLVKALERPESFIRREAVSQLMSSENSIPPFVLDRILDDHPVVTSTAIWSLIENRKSAEFIIENKARLVQSASRVDVSIVLRRNIFRAGQKLKYYPSIEAKAEVVLEIFQAVLHSLPLSVNFTDDVHLDDTLKNFTKVLPKEKYIKIARVRFNYLIQQLKFCSPNDYGLCIGDFVLEYVPSNEADRYKILQNLLYHPETSVAVSTTAYCINRWNSLTPDEQNLCLEVLVMNRNDSFWLKAAALTHDQKIPEQVLTHLNLPQDFASLSPAETINVLSTELLGAAIRMYCGVPYPLEWIVLHHAEQSKWGSVIELIATLPAHDHFEYCLDRCLHWACSGKWFEGDLAWRMLLETVGPKLRDHLVDKLLQHTVSYTGAQLGGYWRQVFEVLKDQEYTELVSKIVEHIDVFQCSNDEFQDLVNLLGIGRALDNILHHFPEDLLMLSIWLQAKNNKYFIENTLSLIRSIYSTQPPRLSFVHKWMQDLVKDISAETFNVIERARKVTIKRVFTAHEAYLKAIPKEKIQNWHFCQRVSVR